MIFHIILFYLINNIMRKFDIKIQALIFLYYILLYTNDKNVYVNITK